MGKKLIKVLTVLVVVLLVFHIGMVYGALKPGA